MKALIDILPPPAMAEPAHSTFWWVALTLLILLALWPGLRRTQRYARFSLRRKIKRQAIEPRMAAAALARLAQQKAIQDPALQQRLLQLRFGRHTPQTQQLLELLRDIS